MKRTIFGALAISFLASGASLAVSDDHNPIGVAGAFEGMITTGCAYNVLNHNARREIDDIVVPGAIGKYGLKMTRYYNSRSTAYLNIMGAGWTHGYQWQWGLPPAPAIFEYPNGEKLDSSCNPPLGVSDYGTVSCNGTCGDFHLSDGGILHFDKSNNYFQLRTITDPHGLVTTLTYYSSGTYLGFLKQVTEPGGRYLYFTYAQAGNPAQSVLQEVDAYDRPGGNQIDSVVYHYASESTGGTTVPTAICLTQVDYNNSTHAFYTYTTDNQPEHPNQPCPCMIKLLPLMQTAQDVRYKGPMRQICYEYQTQGPSPHGAIIAERYSLNGSTTGPRVSKIDPPAPSPLAAEVDFDTSYTETRGDTPTRTFTYTQLHLHRQTDDNCPIPTLGPPQQFLKSYTDFKGKTTNLFYDQTTWYITSVKDANQHTTSYARGAPPPNGIGEITKITHPGATHIDYAYESPPQYPQYDPHYVTSITNERRETTTYTRDGSHRITRIDYPQDANTPVSFEEFSYINNNFGLVSTHHLKNGNYEHFKYDGRGLLVVKTNPTNIADWATATNSAPQTTYAYYTGTDGKPGWIDRVKTMTLPANAQGLHASETYEYDLSATNFSRGLVTKITHADGNYQSFNYDIYGNKLWEENELFKRTTYTYDDYNRVLTVKDPIGQTTGNTTTYTYKPTNGTDQRLHTTSNPDTVTTPAGILTTNVYDENFRKTSTAVGSSTTRFAYDDVGNLTDVTDPRNKITHNGYDNRNRKTSTTEALGTPLAQTTVFHYDGANNIFKIDRPDSNSETKGYDALNRMIWHLVPYWWTSPPENHTTHYFYNPSGTIDHVTDPRGETTHFAYNVSDEKITMTYPGNQSQSWVYDDAHNLSSRTTVHGGTEIQRFSYDNRNRKTGMTWDNVADWATFTYYNDGRLHTATNANSAVTRLYDAGGRLSYDQQSVTGLAGAKTVNYPTYDGDGRLMSMNVSGAGYDYSFSYDTMGRFWKIFATGQNNPSFDYSYDPASNVTHRDSYLPNGVIINQSTPPDSLNRIQGRWIYNNGTAIAAQGYTYDSMNRLCDVTWGSIKDEFGYYSDSELYWAKYSEPVDGPSQIPEGGDPDLDTTTNVDPFSNYQPPDTQEPEPTPPPDELPPGPPADTLTPFLQQDMNGAQRQDGYGYDRGGNRWATEENGVVTGYYVNAMNQYTGVGAPNNVVIGNEHEIQSYQGNIYGYVNDEHLKLVTDGTNTYNLYYDALGRCVKRTLGNVTTYYIYDGEKPVAEYNSGGTLIARNVYGKGIDEILMRTETGVNSGYPFYYGQDHEGSVTHLIDGNPNSNFTGQVLESYKYDVYGAPAMYDKNNNPNSPINSTNFNNRFLFAGREYAATYRGTFVPAFTFYEYRARAYNPALGRFMSEDPKLFDAGDYNFFRYCHNDPVDLTDPMGTEPPVAYSPQEESFKHAEDRAYNNLMAAAQMNSSGGAISVASLASTITIQLHSSVMNYEEAAGLHGSQPRMITEGPAPVRIDVDGTGPTHGDPKADTNHETSYKPNGKSLNADKDNYVARSPSARQGGARLGDHAFFFANDKLVPAIVGDSGHPGVEASLHAVHEAGIPTRDRPGYGPVPATRGGRDVSGSIIYYPTGQPEP